MYVNKPVHWIDHDGVVQRLMPCITTEDPIILPNCGPRFVTVSDRAMIDFEELECVGLVLFPSPQATVGIVAYIESAVDREAPPGFQIFSLLITTRVTLRKHLSPEKQFVETVRSVGSSEGLEVVGLKVLVESINEQQPRTPIIRNLSELVGDIDFTRTENLDVQIDRIADALLVDERQAFRDETEPANRIAIVLAAISEIFDVLVNGAIEPEDDNRIERKQPEGESAPPDEYEAEELDEDQPSVDDTSWSGTKRLILAATPPPFRQATDRELRLLEASESDTSRQRREILRACDWSRNPNRKINILELERQLREFHVGHDAVISELVEIAMMMEFQTRRKGSTKCPPLLFVGPPGVGKTCLARDFATGLGRRSYRLDFGTFEDCECSTWILRGLPKRHPWWNHEGNCRCRPRVRARA